MAEVLVLAELDAEGGLKKVTNELITAARALGTPSVVVAGKPGTADGVVDGDEVGLGRPWVDGLGIVAGQAEDHRLGRAVAVTGGAQGAEELHPHPDRGIE